MRTLANVNPTTDNFSVWLTLTNQLASAMTNEILTANSTLGSTTGNAYLNGVFSANTLVANTGLRGGNNTVASTLSITSDLSVSNTATITGLLTSNNINAQTVNATSVAVGANVTVSTSSVKVGNSTVNTAVLSTSVTTPVLSTANVSCSGNVVTSGLSSTTGTVVTLSSNTLVSNSVTSNVISTAAGYITSNTTTVATVTQTVVDSYPKTSNYFTKWLVSMQSGTGDAVYVCELLMARDSTDATYLTKYGEIYNTAILGTFDTVINGANVELKVTASNTASYTVRVTRFAQ